MDYSKLSEITAKTQEELDAIPDDFRGQIYIEGGTPFAKLHVAKKYYFRVVARENSSVVARGNSSVEARGNSSVEARGNSSVEAWENSSVVAWENSSVVAWGNSSVEAWENSSVVANANSQIVDMLQGAKIKISGNARIVYTPKNIFEFMDFYGIKHTKTKATFYKAVNKYPDETYHSNYDNKFVYEVGRTVSEECDKNVYESCGCGLHISHLSWALDYGRDWNDLSILEVETKISDIVLPINSTELERTIGSSPRGYFICRDKEEFERVNNAIYSAAFSLLRRARANEKKAGLEGQGKLKLGKFYKDYYEAFGE